MKVQCLKIQSFRGIEDLTLEFDPQVNVLVGINGVGKTRILDALSILLSRFIEWIGASSKEDVKDPNDLDISVNKQGLDLEIFLYSDNLHWSVHKVRGQSVHEEDVAAARLRAKRLRSRSAQESKSSIPLAVCYPVGRTVDNIPLEPFDLTKYKSNTAYPFGQLTAYSKALSAKQTSFESFFRWFRNREDLENEIRLDNPINLYEDTQLKAVRKAITSFLPGFKALRVRRSQSLRMTVEKQGQELFINQLSDGEKCLLAMVGDIARRLALANPGLEDSLQGEGVVLIDEIELHLHPQWQRKIIPALTATFPNCQFIVTTHSPQVISHVEPESIYILEATSEGIKAFRPEYSLGRDSNTILEDLMGVSSRPEKQQKDLQELFRLIEEGNLDAAREKAAKLSAEIGSDEAELVGARAAIRRKEILGR